MKDKNDDLRNTERGGNLTSASSSEEAEGGRPPSQPDTSAAAVTSDQNFHRRNISWGVNEILNMTDPVESPPIGRDRSDASTLSQSVKSSRANESVDINDSHVHINLPYQGDTNTRQTIIELPNQLGIVNPMETEAENYLLRAIERSGNEPGAAILSNVPDDAVDQVIERKMSEDQEESNSNSQSQAPRRDPLSWGGSSGASSRGFRRAASTRNVGPQSPTPQQHNYHRRKLTLDEQLFGLTHAMDAIRAESSFPYEEEIPPSSIGTGRVRANTYESGGGGISDVVPEGNEAEEEEVAQDQAYSSYETLGQNAEKFYDQSQPSSDEGGGFTGLMRRGMSRRTFASSDESDVKPDKISEEPSDIEEANGSPPVAPDDEMPMDKQDSKVRPGQAGSTERRKSRWDRARAAIFDEWVLTSEMKNFIRPKQNTIRLFLTAAIVYIAIPCLGTAAILFYLAGNPPTGIRANYGNLTHGAKLVNTDGQVIDPNSTSVSYFLIFAVRQVVTLTLAMGSQLFLIDFLAIDRGYLFKLGSRLPLFIMQARGWPFVLFFWSVYDWALNSGNKPFFTHWLHSQKAIKLFNHCNPDGNLIRSVWNHRILSLATGISAAVAVKRFWMGIFLGRQTYHRYSDKLASLMQKMLLISQVAGLSRQIISPQGRNMLHKRESTIEAVLTEDKIGGLMDNIEDDTSEIGSRTAAEESVGINTGAGAEVRGAPVIDPDDRNPLTGKLSTLQKNRIVRLLGAWEEPTTDTRSNDTISIVSLMHFRRAMNHLRTDLPFSASFGPAGTREDCVTSAQDVFSRLMTLSDYDDSLNFEVLALLGAKTDGSLDQDKLMELIKLFRPDRDGSLSIVHFVRSVDKVYKEIRMLRASVHNSSKVDGQFEGIFNFVFYVVIITIALNTLGFNPLALFVSVSGLVLGFAFMIGTASSMYFEGLLFILIRRPYGIGDCMHVSDPNYDTSYTGSAFWYVEDISLFSTQVRYFYTNERASLSNGSLANSRIINSSKSYNASVYHFLKFPLDVPYEKVKIFHEALENFVRNRPREWIGLSSFRAAEVNANLAYIEYMVCIDHRESWAYWTQVKTSQSDLMGFGVELAKKLDIVYKQPTLPIDLNLTHQQSQEILAQMAPGSPTPLAAPDGAVRPSGHKPSLSRDFQSLAAQFPHRAPVKRA